MGWPVLQAQECKIFTPTPNPPKNVVSLQYDHVCLTSFHCVWQKKKKKTEKHTLLTSKLLHVRNHSIIWLYIPNTSISKCINYVMFISLHVIITKPLFWQFCFVSDSQILEGIQLWLLFPFLSLSPCYFDKKQANGERQLISILKLHIYWRLLYQNKLISPKNPFLRSILCIFSIVSILIKRYDNVSESSFNVTMHEICVVNERPNDVSEFSLQVWSNIYEKCNDKK